jgi:hypothetical protein
MTAKSSAPPPASSSRSQKDSVAKGSAGPSLRPSNLSGLTCPGLCRLGRHRRSRRNRASLAQPVGRAGFCRIFGPPGLRPLPLRRAAFLALAHVVFLAPARVVFLALAHVVFLALAHVVFLALARLGLAPRKVRPQRCCKPLLFRLGPSMGHALV